MIAQNTPQLNPDRNSPHPTLNQPQEEAVKAPDRPLLIVAGAGTGKTRTLTMRILHLLERGVPASNICALTFTNKAAREIEERVLRAYKGIWPGGEAPFLGTFHSFGARILRKECRLFGRTPDFVIFDTQDMIQVVKKAMKNLGIVETKKVRGKDRGPAFFAHKIDHIKNGMMPMPRIVALESSEQGNPEDESIAKVFIEYEKELQKNNAFDFNDLIQKVVTAFRNNPEVLAKYHRRYSHFLVDEYQDVNNLQAEMVRLLAANRGNISAVGDARQVLYSWRGSNIEVFLNFQKDWPNAQVILLDQNYRSTQTIIGAASAMIGNSTILKKQDLWTANDVGEKIQLIEAIDEEDEAAWVADEIMKRLREEKIDGIDDSDGAGDPAGSHRQKSVAILYRTNAQSRAIEQALLRRNIPYAVYGGLKFYERKEVRDVVAGLRYALNPSDEVSKERLEKSLTKTRFRNFAAALSAHFEKNPDHRTNNPAEVIKIFLTSTEYLSLIERNMTNGLERRENIAELIEFATEFDSLAHMIEEISLVQATDAEEETKRKRSKRGLNGNGGESLLAGGGVHATMDIPSPSTPKPVQLMTMHLAKGLEFDTVFIVGATEGLLPHARSIESDAELEEERRLLYVAMTRARKQLAISFYDIPSRFLSEIPEQFLEFKSIATADGTFVDLEDEERYISY